MKRSKFSDEQILAIVKEGEAGRKVANLCRMHGITEQTYDRWKAKYGGMELSDLQRMKQLEDENRRLKHIVAEQTLDIQSVESGGGKKVVGPSAKRDAVGWLVKAQQTSVRRAWRRAPFEEVINGDVRPLSDDPWLTVVGVVGPTRYRELAKQRATLYLPAKQFLDTSRVLVVRTPASPALIASLSRAHVRAVDPGVQIVRVVPFGRLLDVPLARPRFNMWLVGIFAIAALLLASVGLYAVIAAFVRQRDREIGIRIALGATNANIRNLVLTEASRLAGLGAAAGLIGALVATRFVRGMLFEVAPLDAPTLAGATLLLILACLLAAYVPTRRARRVDAAALLRSQ